MKSILNTQDMADVTVMRRPRAEDGVKFGGVFEVECRRPNGELRWRTRDHNLVTNIGLQHMLDVVFSGETPVTTWYVGLIADGETLDAGDTMGSHAGWTEFTDYDEAARQEYVEVRSSQALTNAASKADFTIAGDSSVIAGAFLASGDTAGGTDGTLLAEVKFTGGDKSADDDDTLSVTYTFSAADA